MSSSATPPVVNGFDIANYGAGTLAGDKWFCDPICRGQTFTTGAVPVLLKSISYHIPPGQSAQAVKTYVVRVGRVSGTRFTLLYSDRFTQTFPWNGGEFMTWTFAEPVALEANTTYGVDIEMKSSTSVWQTGIPYLSTTADLYPGGQGYGFGLQQGPRDDSTLVLGKGRDRVFHLDLKDPTATGPEPVHHVPIGIAGPGAERPAPAPRNPSTTRPLGPDELAISGWKRGTPGPRGVSANPVSPLFDDRAWGAAGKPDQLGVKANETVVFRARFSIDAARQARLKSARLILSGGSAVGAVYLNGWKVGEGREGREPWELNINSLLRVGENVIAVVVTAAAGAGRMADDCRIAP